MNFLPKISSIPFIEENKENNFLFNYLEYKWASLNCKIFDFVSKRKLKKLINENNYKEILKTIIDYEKISGVTYDTENIKNFAIYNLINNEFNNLKFSEKIKF
jgi:hypothetical protein